MIRGIDMKNKTNLIVRAGLEGDSLINLEPTRTPETLLQEAINGG